ncbi:N-acetylglucosamine-specific PTS transporter subunit IIBC [Paludicola sp. MB14-C6]|uniref:N-acetylglucosamine-specific PTS transporter subunit IIBC n=1 Tax=Paludihabitans sp. MB14-C6 TaxID=3070656 RepID=UPI0027DC0AEE|nr:N-acetylglucosamine-specific PTS transporter subunit IIBC [Paludicola sp. MB14-C6]WMJ22862.1 N-acetylglucosamine-specific PTS transporter subunit IIBC [Paludicola sp. MB14-C6]
MMKYMQRLGKSLMLPVACLPVAGILLGIGYWVDPTGWGKNSIIAAFLIAAGGAIIDNIPILFAVGISVGMAKDKDGTSALAGIVSWLVITTMLSPKTVELLTGAKAAAGFSKIQNVLIGIICGLLASVCYNRFKDVKLPTALAFFSGKRCVAIVTAFFSLLISIVLFFIWPTVYAGLVIFGKWMLSLGSLGAGLYVFFNRLLIPVGLHHALNAVFWFDTAGVNDLANYWSGKGVLGQTGIYMTGFFPFMMFGLPGAALAMFQTAKTNKKKIVAGLLGSAALCAFLTGVTEPIEFAFMFVAPVLYLVHAVLAGITGGIMAALPIRAGFNFSGGFIDWFLSLKAPMEQNSLWIIPIGIVVFLVYYIVFRVLITKFNFKTPGREDDDMEEEKAIVLKNDNFTEVATKILAALGGKENITSVDNCITRLRLEIKDYTLVNEKAIKAAGAAGVIRPSKTSVQVIIGTQVQFVADEFSKLIV